mmetsp:Transcript_95251/g.226851  ORF Transcript_95251/g.226851 Transcript_95251/m.226851 type:complete len:202 (-) Transcript_95251:328-933(-)
MPCPILCFGERRKWQASQFLKAAQRKVRHIAAPRMSLTPSPAKLRLSMKASLHDGQWMRATQMALKRRLQGPSLRVLQMPRRWFLRVHRFRLRPTPRRAMVLLPRSPWFLRASRRSPRQMPCTGLVQEPQQMLRSLFSQLQICGPPARTLCTKTPLLPAMQTFHMHLCSRHPRRRSMRAVLLLHVLISSVGMRAWQTLRGR